MFYAGFWIRVAAYLIDIIVLGISITVLQTLTGIDFGVDLDAALAPTGVEPEGASPLGSLLNFIIGIAYFAGLESSSWQATVGKKVLGLVVVDDGGNRISFLRGVGRYLAKILSALILLIGYIMVAFTAKKQGLHDMLASTLVIKGKPGEHATAGVFE
ncbi:RDD family protein [Aurantiacibacter hainanensis]|uniref:RDD family protein n=1 Tax=Aurantiacibacter hainanensis TaxID=3076114 RepID=UPI0030C69AEB